MEAQFLAIILCLLRGNGNAPQSPQIIIGRPQDYIKPLDRPCDTVKRVKAELKEFKSFLRSMTQLSSLNVKNPYDVVMGFHPFIDTPNLHKHVRPMPTSAKFVLRSIMKTCKSWCVLPGGGRNMSDSRLQALKFAQAFHESVVRVRLSDFFEPRPNSDCVDPGLVKSLRMFESDHGCI